MSVMTTRVLSWAGKIKGTSLPAPRIGPTALVKAVELVDAQRNKHTDLCQYVTITDMLQ